MWSLGEQSQDEYFQILPNFVSLIRCQAKFSLSKSEISLPLVPLDDSIYNIFAYLCSCISICPLNFRVLCCFFFKLSPSNYLSLSIPFTIFSPDLGYLIHNCILASFLGCQFLVSLYIYPLLPDYFFQCY